MHVIPDEKWTGVVFIYSSAQEFVKQVVGRLPGNPFSYKRIDLWWYLSTWSGCFATQPSSYKWLASMYWCMEMMLVPPLPVLIPKFLKWNSSNHKILSMCRLLITKCSIHIIISMFLLKFECLLHLPSSFLPMFLQLLCGAAVESSSALHLSTVRSSQPLHLPFCLSQVMM